MITGTGGYGSASLLNSFNSVPDVENSEELIRKEGP